MLLLTTFVVSMGVAMKTVKPWCLVLGMVGVLSVQGETATKAQIVGTGEKETRSLPVHSGAVTLKVADYNRAYQLLTAATIAEHGELLAARTEVKDSGRRHGWLRLCVPSDRLGDFLPRIRAVGVLYGERFISEENTSTYDSLGRRIVRLREHEGRLEGVLQTRSNRLRGSDILYLQERLFRASVDESLLAQTQDDLVHKSEKSLLTVELFEPLPIRARDRAGRSLSAHWIGARERSGEAMTALFRRVLTALAFVLTFTPLWLPCLDCHCSAASALSAAAMAGCDRGHRESRVYKVRFRSVLSAVRGEGSAVHWKNARSFPIVRPD